MIIDRKEELKQLNKSLTNDNMMLSTFKKSMNMPHTYAEQYPNFLEGLQNMQNQRLEKIKQELYQQVNENHHQLSYRKVIEGKIHEIQKIEEARHQQRIKEQQMESRRNYEDIKMRYQQDMDIYNKHQSLLKQNQHYRDQLEEFTNVNHGLLDRFNRNEYLERRAHLMENQSQIKRQMQELERRKNQDNFEYKKSVGDLEQSMLKSILVKPQRGEQKSYSYDLKNQMKEQSLRKFQEKNSKKEKVEMNNIFGGVHGNEREKMLRFIDKRLGIDSYGAKASCNYSMNGPQEIPQNRNTGRMSEIIQTQNPERQNSERFQSNTPRSDSRRSNQKKESSQLLQSPSIQANHSVEPTSAGQKGFRSYDLISGKNKFYHYQ